MRVAPSNNHRPPPSVRHPQVGVHIADVSYFVRPNTSIDAEAAHRATSIYLVQLCVPMLPRALCEVLCSLNPGEDKLTFSVLFVVAKDGRVSPSLSTLPLLRMCVCVL